MTLCKKFNCKNKDCKRHPDLWAHSEPPHNFVHLEGNPMYCKKNDWNGNQYSGKEKDE